MKKLLLAALVLAVFGGAGLYVYQQNQDKPQPTNNAQTAQNNSQQQTSNDPSEGGKYLVIKEWGVRLKLADDVKDATYRLNGVEANSIGLNTPTLTNIAKQYPECESAEYSIALNRAKPGDDHFGSPWTEGELQDVGKKIKDYYYYQSAGQPCFPDDRSFKSPEELNLVRSSLSDASNSVEAY